MKQELEKQLIIKYPTIFKQTSLPPEQSCMFFGLECGDGWYGILDFLCKRLTQMDKENSCCATQVKEKFGGLRFYVSNATEEQWSLIQEIELLSYYICEKCGMSIGVKQTERWISSLCEKCMKEHNANL